MCEKFVNVCMYLFHCLQKMDLNKSSYTKMYGVKWYEMILLPWPRPYADPRMTLIFYVNIYYVSCLIYHVVFFPVDAELKIDKISAPVCDVFIYSSSAMRTIPWAMCWSCDDNSLTLQGIIEDQYFQSTLKYDILLYLFFVMLVCVVIWALMLIV